VKTDCKTSGPGGFRPTNRQRRQDSVLLTPLSMSTFAPVDRFSPPLLEFNNFMLENESKVLPVNTEEGSEKYFGDFCSLSLLSTASFLPLAIQTMA
jgi:hypothetical protein